MARKALAPLGAEHAVDDPTPLALGAAPFGNMYAPVSDEEAQETVDAAWEEGVRYFDVAPLYGHGEAERRLGRALARRPRDEFVVSTKVGRLIRQADPSEAQAGSWKIEPGTKCVFDFSYDAVMRSVEDSLHRLGTDRIDLIYIHDPDDHYAAASRDAYRALDALRSDGIVRAIGVGTANSELLKDFAETGVYDYFLLAARYTLLNQHLAEELLELCEAKGIGVVAGSVFNSGILADPRPGATYDYTTAPPEVLQRAQRMQELCTRYGVPLPAAAMQFPARHPAVCAVLVGARTAQEVRVDAELYRTPIPDQLWEALAERRYGAVA